MFVGFTSYCNEWWVSFHTSKPERKCVHGHEVRWERVCVGRDLQHIESLDLCKLRTLAHKLRRAVATVRASEQQGVRPKWESWEVETLRERVSLYLQYRTIVSMQDESGGHLPGGVAIAEEASMEDTRESLLKAWHWAHRDDAWHRRYEDELRRYTEGGVSEAHRDEGGVSEAHRDEGGVSEAHRDEGGVSEAHRDEGDADDDDSSDWAICPITRQVMRDPVVCSDGHTYERSAIERWLEGSRTSPNTGAQLHNAQRIPNFALRKALAQRGRS